VSPASVTACKIIQDHSGEFWTGNVKFPVEKVKNAVGDSVVARRQVDTAGPSQVSEL